MLQPDTYDSVAVDPKQFTTTHWSVVSQAADSQSPHVLAALDHLCRTYWFPLYAYVRRHNHDPEEAKDLTQGFFAELLQKKQLAHADRRKGKFRSWLLGVLNHYLAHEWEKGQAQKRGGGQSIFSLDEELAERRYQSQPVTVSTAEMAFDRGWAITILEQAQRRLRTEYAGAGRLDAYEQFSPCLAGEDRSATYSEIGSRLGMSEGAVKTAIHRARRRFLELMREEVGQTVSHAAEIDDEIRYLLTVVG